MPTVRNIKYANRRDHNVYIGRTIYGNYGEVYRKGSPLANPFKEIRKATEKERDAERERVIAEYGVWLRDKVKAGDPKVWQALRSINETSVLMCYCYPRNCHGHKIVAMWTWAKNKGLLDHVTTPHTSDKTLKTVAAAVVKATEDQANTLAKTIATAYQKPGPPATLYATGPLDMPTIMARMRASLLAEQADRQRIDTHLDEQLLAEHVTTCPDCDAPKYIHLAHHHEGCSCEDCHHNALAKTLPPRKKQGRGAPRKPKGIVYSVADPMYNRLDDIEADLAELTTLRDYLSITHTDANAPALHATA